MKKEKIKILKNAKIYFVSSEDLSNDSTINILENFLKAGGKLFQIREKTYSKDKLKELCSKVRVLADKYNAIFILNDDVEMAKKVNADGVHLGKSDLSIDKAREILGDEFIIGASTHSVEDILNAETLGADYVNIGPIFPTNTKNCKPLDLKLLEEMVNITKIPFTFMGGIKKENIAKLLKYKPSALAMVTEITKSKDVYSKTLELLSL